MNGRREFVTPDLARLPIGFIADGTNHITEDLCRSDSGSETGYLLHGS
jgi:hypothetical protein